MKKVLASFLLAIFVLNVASAFAVDIDLSKYSDAEIREIMVLVQKEMISRKMVKSARVPGGTYTIGVDIPAGRYSISVADKNAWIGPDLTIWNDSSQSKTLVDKYISVDGSYIIELADGNVIMVSKDVILETFSGITFE